MKALQKTAIVLALAAAAAGAQAAEVYGTIDAGFTHATAAGNDVSKLTSGGLTDSFIGFKSSEDLGGGLKAGFGLEAGVDVTSGATGANLFSREVGVNLTQGANTLKLGRLQTLSYGTVKQFDVFHGGSLGAARSVFDTAGEYSNGTIGYTFSQGGLTASVTDALGGQVNGGLSQGSVTALNVGYTMGAASAAVTYTDSRNGVNNTLIGGAYDFGVAKVTGLYQTASGTAQDSSYVFGISAPVKQFTVLASAGRAKATSGETADMYNIGAEYNLSKRTIAYASVGRMDSDVVSGTVYSIGVNHKF